MNNKTAIIQINNSPVIATQVTEYCPITDHTKVVYDFFCEINSYKSLIYYFKKVNALYTEKEIKNIPNHFKIWARPEDCRLADRLALNEYYSHLKISDNSRGTYTLRQITFQDTMFLGDNVYQVFDHHNSFVVSFKAKRFCNGIIAPLINIPLTKEYIDRIVNDIHSYLQKNHPQLI